MQKYIKLGRFYISRGWVKHKFLRKQHVSVFLVVKNGDIMDFELENYGNKQKSVIFVVIILKILSTKTTLSTHESKS